MAPLRDNRAMFWRIVRRLVFAHRARLFVILLALGAGAAVTAALLNLQVDAKRRLTSEFRAFGPNIVLSPKGASANSSSGTLDEAALNAIPLAAEAVRVSPSSFLSLIVSVSAPPAPKSILAVAVGHQPFASLFAMHSKEIPQWPASACVLGKHVAAQIDATQGVELQLQSDGRIQTCRVASVVATGGPEDDQVWMALPMAQKLAAAPGQVSAIELTASGTPSAIASYVAELQRALPQLEVRPLRQFTEAQAKIYSRIAGLLDFTVALVLILTSLCVMAAMANVAAERRNDVGLMKAIGGAKRRVLRLFLAEATLLGLAGGILGAAAGIALSIYLGKAVFGLAARPRLVVYPVSVALTMFVAILSAFPLRRLAGVRPASVFRGEA
ncbi:MAG TPA: ABC transporter permease [Candidatus Acidoferrales bacterium]|nr:ABC transporter permease [Candidatus Acidoferrales bacterium]